MFNPFPDRREYLGKYQLENLPMDGNGLVLGEGCEIDEHAGRVVTSLEVGAKRRFEHVLVVVLIVLVGNIRFETS